MSDLRSVEDCFGELIELETAELRADYLRRIGSEDAILQGQLEKLLEAHEQAGSFLHQESFETTREFEPESLVNSSIGPYKLRERLGAGGMGVVWAAEQRLPLKRKVALKLIKPGMDSEQVIARFEAEREALSRMDHPNIARVLDAGTTQQGHPYFVMELIRGVPVTEYCDKKRLTIHQRLELFTKICSAVQHAHQKGIIHRDIKPSNVLVSEQDGQPIPKVIDFGVAKALHQPLTDRSLYTGVFQALGTLQYMSPEQAGLSIADVDTRADVYGLGVLLYELLTGSTPFEKEQLASAAFDEACRIIREQEPPKPSTRLSSLGERALTVSQTRNSDPHQLSRLVRGDLDWIVTKSLDKDRSRRYESATSLAADVNRYLNSEPIEARPPSMIYRLRKVVQRNRSAATFATVLVTLVIVASAAVLSSWRDAIVQRKTVTGLLAENRNYIIERILLKSFEGDNSDEVLSLLGQHSLDAHDEWPEVLAASAAVHSGEYSKATAILEPLVKEWPGNIPANALLSTAYMHQGDWDGAVRLQNQIKSAIPRPDFEVIDKLFLGYSLPFIDNKRSVRLLREVLDEEPTWLVCHALLADIELWNARFENDSRVLAGASSKAKALLEFLPNNPFVLNVNLHAVATEIEFRQAAGRGNDIEDLKLRASPLIQALAPFEEFILSQQMPANYYRLVGDETNVIKALEKVLLRGTRSKVWPTVGGLAQFLNDDEKLLGMIEEKDMSDPRDRNWLMSAKAYVLVNNPNRRDEALQIFYELAENAVTPFEQYNAIYIPLLLGEKELALVYARKWSDESQSEDSHTREYVSMFQETELLRIVLTGQPSTSLTTSRVSRNMGEIILGLLAIADGERETAIRHLSN